MTGKPTLWLGGMAVVLGCGVARADDAADAVIQRARAAARKVTILRADVEFNAAGKQYPGFATVARPNLAHVELKGSAVPLLVADGKAVYRYAPSRGVFFKSDAASPAEVTPYLSVEQLRGVLDPDRAVMVPDHATTRYVGKQTVEGSEFDVVEVRSVTPDPAVKPAAPTTPAAAPIRVERTSRYFVSTRDSLIYRLETTLKVGERESVTTAILKNVHVNEQVDPAVFQWTAPANAKLYVPPTPEELKRAQEERNKNLVKVGGAAPEFTLPQPGGKLLSLTDVVKKNKVTLVNFWFVNCGFCRTEFPHLQQLYTELKDQGFAMVAVDARDSEAAVQKFIKDTGYTFPVALGGEGAAYTIGKTYGVTGYPTNFLIGPDGKVLWVGVGYTPDRFEALKTAVMGALK